MNEKHRILIADDDAVTQRLLHELLSRLGYDVSVARDGEEAIALASEQTEIAIVDLRMPKVSGLECLAHFRSERPLMETIVMSSAGIEEAVEAMGLGAFWYLQKPINRKELAPLIQRALTHRRISQQNYELHEATHMSSERVRLDGSSYKMRLMKSEGRRLLKEHQTILLQGEPGTEKLMFAKYLHQASTRKASPFVVFHAGAKSRAAVMPDFFGHSSEYFPNSRRARPGKVEFADGGTLYIEDIGEIPFEFQEPLANFLRTRTATRLGADTERKFSLRCICATRYDIDELHQSGVLMDELHKLLGASVELPPLRERKGDISELAQSYVKKVSKHRRGSEVLLSDEALAKLIDERWPGNLVQLEDTLERAIHLCKEGVIAVEDLSMGNSQCTSSDEGTLTLKELEKRAFALALHECAGNQTEAAKRLGVSAKTMYNKMKRLGLK